MKDTKTFAEDLFFFAKTYNDELVLKILNNAATIYENDTLVELLHQAHVRAAEDEARFMDKFVSDVKDTVEFDDMATKWFKREEEIKHTRKSILNDASSFHAVCKHLVWEIIGEED